MSMLTRFAALGGAVAQTYVDDVFNVYLYTGNGSTQTITTGLDTLTDGGTIWFKGRQSLAGGTANQIIMPDANPNNDLFLDTASTAGTSGTTSLSRTTTGFTLNSAGSVNFNTQNFVARSFKKAAKFFDVVTYTGNGVQGRLINHSLGVRPGLVVIKTTGTSGDWTVFLRTGDQSLAMGSNSSSNILALNSTNGSNYIYTDPSVNTNFSASQFSPDALFFTSATNANGTAYVAYLFADDTASTGIIRTGSFTTDGSGNATVTSLGWEPQFLLVKASSTTGDWIMLDNVRGWDLGSTDSLLRANSSNPESSSTNYGNPTSDGFSFSGGSASATYIYMAIRRSNKPPTAGTQVFQPTVYTGTNVDNRLVDTTIAPDMVWVRQRDDTVLGGFVVGDRLRGQPYLLTGSTAAAVDDANAFDRQLVSATEFGSAFSAMNGFYCGNDATAKLNANTTANNHIAEAFKRAAGFFDVVAFTGVSTGTKNVVHNLGVKPEFIITTRRTGSSAWHTAANFNASGSNYIRGILYLTSADQGASSTLISAISATNFTVGISFDTTDPWIAYLFASVAGVSKVGTYTGNGGTAGTNGTSQTINCGFTTGARFVLIKRYDSTGSWYVFDSARGIVAAADPYLLTNSTAAEVTTVDAVDADNSGFIVNQTSGTDLNVTSATYLYLAIA